MTHISGMPYATLIHGRLLFLGQGNKMNLSGGRTRELSGNEFWPNLPPVLIAEFAASYSPICGGLNSGAMTNRDGAFFTSPVTDGRMRCANISGQLCTGSTLFDVFAEFHKRQFSVSLTVPQ